MHSYLSFEEIASALKEPSSASCWLCGTRPLCAHWSLRVFQLKSWWHPAQDKSLLCAGPSPPLAVQGMQEVGHHSWLSGPPVTS